MCTSFTWRRDDILVAMNFDNCNPFKISNKDSKQFVIQAGGAPCFGVNSKGVFINHMAVDSNEKGFYKRGKNVIHTIQLIRDILNDKLQEENISNYLEIKEIVNVPNSSCHSMISDKNGNVWAIEPGRGVIYSPAHDSPYFLMTNFSLYDYKKSGIMAGSGTDRYKIADGILKKTENLNVNTAFELLKAVKQNAGEWQTSFSMVYSQKENSIYYCHKGDYENILIHSFAL